MVQKAALIAGCQAHRGGQGRRRENVAQFAALSKTGIGGGGRLAVGPVWANARGCGLGTVAAIDGLFVRADKKLRSKDVSYIPPEKEPYVACLFRGEAFGPVSRSRPTRHCCRVEIGASH